MINEYQQQFLEHIDADGVRYLVIGGQARLVHFGNTTSDLDVWVDIGDANLAALERSLVGWVDRYPAHWFKTLVAPLALRAGLQFKFPDVDGCLFLSADGELLEIGTTNGVDVLTSVRGADFGECYSRRLMSAISGLNVPFLGAADLDAISPPKASQA
ncbi:hypothetical protein [Hyphomicrobiales bacterium]|jgi:hypothetical protein|uniref:hypothetical protein n=1 Tax=Agrobacterium cavarae TaxID=2528239 RepID=UPI000DE0277F